MLELIEKRILRAISQAEFYKAVLPMDGATKEMHGGQKLPSCRQRVKRDKFNGACLSD